MFHLISIQWFITVALHTDIRLINHCLHKIHVCKWSRNNAVFILVMEKRSSSLSVWKYSKLCGSLANPACFVNLAQGILCCRSLGDLPCCYKVFGHCSLYCELGSRSDSFPVGPQELLFATYSGQFLGAAKTWRKSDSVASGSHLCFFFFFFYVVLLVSSTNDVQLWWELAPLLFPLWLGMSCFPKGSLKQSLVHQWRESGAEVPSPVGSGRKDEIASEISFLPLETERGSAAAFLRGDALQAYPTGRAPLQSLFGIVISFYALFIQV